MLLDRHIVGKCLLDKESAAIVKLLNPFQLGAGVAGGAQAIVHATTMLCDTIDRETHAKVDLDLQNAYERCLHIGGCHLHIGGPPILRGSCVLADI
jgi:hypothetical protein